LPRVGVTPDQRAKAAAVHEYDIAHIQKNRATVDQEFVDVRVQRFAFLAGDDPSRAMDDGNAANLSGAEGQKQAKLRSGHTVAKESLALRENGQIIRPFRGFATLPNLSE
jgi:hypothetical protein